MVNVSGNFRRGKPRFWTQEKMVDELRRIKAADEPINQTSLFVNYPRLYHAVTNWPGGWFGLVEEAGFDPQKEALGRLKGWHISKRER